MIYRAERSLSFVDWGQPIDWSHPLSLGLRGFWLAGPNPTGFGSLRWRDISGYHNHGTLTNMDPATDWVGEAPPGGGGSLDIGGGSGYVALPSAFPPPVLNDELDAGAITVRFRTTPATSSARQMLFLYCDKDGLSDFTWFSIGHATSALADESIGFQCAGNSSGTLEMYIRQGHDWLADDEWPTATAIVNGSDNQIVVDGKTYSMHFRNGSASTASFTGDNNDTNWIGRRIFNGSTEDSALEGTVSCVMVHDRAMSANEAVSLHRELSQGYPNLLARTSPTTYFAPEQAAPAGTILPLVNHYQCA